MSSSPSGSPTSPPNTYTHVHILSLYFQKGAHAKMISIPSHLTHTENRQEGPIRYTKLSQQHSFHCFSSVWKTWPEIVLRFSVICNVMEM